MTATSSINLFIPKVLNMGPMIVILDIAVIGIVSAPAVRCDIVTCDVAIIRKKEIAVFTYQERQIHYVFHGLQGEEKWKQEMTRISL